jgi:hypothetical protein
MIKLQLNYPAKIKVNKVAIAHPTLEELESELIQASHTSAP